MSFQYTIKEGFAGFSRQKLAAVGSILTITISLLLLGMFYLVSIQASRAVEQIRQQVDVEVFLDESLKKNKLVDVQLQIQAVEGIASAEYFSKEDAAEFFKKEFEEDINNVLDFNPFPASFKITVKDAFRTAERVEEMQKKLKAIKGVDDVVYRKDMLEFFDSRTKGLNSIALALGIFLALSAVILVSNSIRLTIVARKNSIQVMKLVGATRWFIRAPFLIEGMLIGTLGGIFAAGLLFYFVTSTKGILPFELTSIVQTTLRFYLMIIVTGLGLGLLGSLLSARKYISESVV
ncbi:MAG: ABC transporter permease [Ignavibacteriales bacterium]|nr:ABC transporter permease [Ignavibacteriales bacterium]